MWRQRKSTKIRRSPIVVGKILQWASWNALKVQVKEATQVLPRLEERI